MYSPFNQKKIIVYLYLEAGLLLAEVWKSFNLYSSKKYHVFPSNSLLNKSDFQIQEFSCVLLPYFYFNINPV